MPMPQTRQQEPRQRRLKIAAAARRTAIHTPGSAATLQPVEKPATVLRLGPVDVEALRTQVARLSENVWERENAVKENDFFCFTHTRHIIFRFIPPNRTSACYYSLPIWNLWQRWLLPVMTRVAASYGYAEPVYPKAMLARLAAGHGIDRHEDSGGMTPLVHKIHVPLETSPQATFTVGSDTFHLAAGFAYEVNNVAPHGAFNGGAEDRIHFIFEVFDGTGVAWNQRRLDPRTRAAHARSAEVGEPPSLGTT